jgi:hypothetical protein
MSAARDDCPSGPFTERETVPFNAPPIGRRVLRLLRLLSECFQHGWVADAPNESRREPERLRKGGGLR